MPTIRITRRDLRKLAIILDMHDINTKNTTTYNRQAAWIKRITRQLRTTAEHP